MQLQWVYDVAMKDPSVVVCGPLTHVFRMNCDRGLLGLKYFFGFDL
jgi:hypothetical protein